ncbi:putative membrane protein [Peptoniphilus sp. ING2-D1G]|nr:putative membrane protein [Peptoniphilus sp. ING2-D1G]
MDTLKYSFKQSIPTLFGYAFLSLAYSILAATEGLSFFTTVFMSFICYAGSLQFALLAMMSSNTSIFSIILIALILGFRQIFYGLSFIEKFKMNKLKKLYCIFALTDETYSILVSLKPPKNVDIYKAYFQISLLNHSYWVLGGLIGYLVGQMLPFSTQGIDFTMTALFIVLLLENMENSKSYFSHTTGIILSVLCIIFFGPDKFIIPAISVTVLLLIFKGKKEGEI